MTLEELREELAAGRLRPAYLVAGEEPLLRDEALAALTAAALPEEQRDFDHDRLDAAATSGGRLLDALRTLPALAPRRLVVLREPEARRASRDLGDAIVEAVRLLEDGGPWVFVISATRVDRRTAWVKAFREPAGFVNCDPPRRAREVTAFVRAEAKRQGLALGPGVAELLAERVGPHLLALRQELTKAALSADAGRVTREDVLALTSDLAEEPIWDLTDAIGEGRRADALGVLGKLLGAGAPPPVVLGALASHFRRLLRVRAGGEVPGPPFVRRKLESQARRYSLDRATACLAVIHETDEALKGQGALPPDLALERLVLGLSS